MVIKMISKTTAKDQDGWYYSFRKRNDDTLIIQQKKKIKTKTHIYNEVYIYGDGVLDKLKEVIMN